METFLTPGRACCIRLWILCVALRGSDGSETSARDRADSDSDSRGIKVICTNTMITDLARRIAGSDDRVNGIIKEGEDPHVYNERPRDAQTFAAADRGLMNGLHLESALLHIIEHNTANARIVALAESDPINPLGSHIAGEAVLKAIHHLRHGDPATAAPIKRMPPPTASGWQR